MKVLKFIAVLFLLIGGVNTAAAGLSLVFRDNPYFHLARELMPVGMLAISTALNISLAAELRKAKGLN